MSFGDRCFAGSIHWYFKFVVEIYKLLTIFGFVIEPATLGLAYLGYFTSYDGLLGSLVGKVRNSRVDRHCVLGFKFFSVRAVIAGSGKCRGYQHKNGGLEDHGAKFAVFR